MTSTGLGVLGGSLVLFSLGLIAECLVRILDEMQKRQLYVVDHVVGLGRDSRAVS